jgi:pentatricopeptide repeat protein
MPELITFSVLICSLYNKGQLENAHKVLEDMDKECMNPNVYKKILDCTILRCSTKGLVPDEPTIFL